MDLGPWLDWQGFLQQTGEDCSGKHKIAWLVVHGSELKMEIERTSTNLVHLNIDLSRYCTMINNIRTNYWYYYNSCYSIVVSILLRRGDGNLFSFALLSSQAIYSFVSAFISHLVCLIISFYHHKQNNGFTNKNLIYPTYFKLLNFKWYTLIHVQAEINPIWLLYIQVNINPYQ